jgi:hypothetical protein
MIPLSSKERVCDESGEFSTDYIGDFNVDLHTVSKYKFLISSSCILGLSSLNQSASKSSSLSTFLLQRDNPQFRKGI